MPGGGGKRGRQLLVVHVGEGGGVPEEKSEAKAFQMRGGDRRQMEEEEGDGAVALEGSVVLLVFVVA